MRRLILLLCFTAILAFPVTSRATSDAEEMMATFLNLKGQLCATIVNIAPLKIKDTYEVRCIEYRGGSGTVDYIVNVSTGEVFKR